MVLLNFVYNIPVRIVKEQRLEGMVFDLFEINMDVGVG